MLIGTYFCSVQTAAAEPSELPNILAEQGAAGFGKFYGVSAEEMEKGMRQAPWAYYGRVQTRTQEVIVESNTPLPVPPDVYVTRFINGEILEEFSLYDLYERHLYVAASGRDFYENLSADKTPKPYSDESKGAFFRLAHSVGTPLAIISHAFPTGQGGIHDEVVETTFPYHLTWGQYEEVMAKVVARRINSHSIVFSIDVPSKNVAYSAEVEWDSELREALPDTMQMVDWRQASGKSFATLGDARRATSTSTSTSTKHRGGKRSRVNSKASPTAPPCLLF
ncbi:hypothetical protein CSQ96_26075 [Janthinobacterium sp. BJB412]|nr:hypothetical protein CSQ96_26075 [Janthinobacterium sp. BJB412]